MVNHGMANQKNNENLLTETSLRAGEAVSKVKEVFLKRGRLTFEEYKEFLYSYYEVNKVEE